MNFGQVQQPYRQCEIYYGQTTMASIVNKAIQTKEKIKWVSFFDDQDTHFNVVTIRIRSREGLSIEFGTTSASGSRQYSSDE